MVANAKHELNNEIMLVRISLAALLVCGAIPHSSDRAFREPRPVEPKRLRLGAMFHFDTESRTWFVAEVVEGLPAQEAGLQKGDVLVELAGVHVAPDGKEDLLGPDAPHVKRMQAAMEALENADESTAIEIHILRDGEPIVVKAHLRAKDEDDDDEDSDEPE